MSFKVGEFNVSLCGASYDNKTGILYQLIIIDKFDEEDKPGGHKAYYALGNIEGFLLDVEILRELWGKPEYSKLIEIPKTYKII